MRRVLITLLVAVGVTAVVLALALSRSKGSVPPIIDRFLGHTFGGKTFGSAGTYVTEHMADDVGDEPYAIRCKRYVHMLGAYRGVELVDKPVDEVNRIDSNLRIAFEGAIVDAKIRVVRVSGRWLVDDVWIDAPPELEYDGHIMLMDKRTAPGFQAFLRGEPWMLWVDLSGSEQERIGRAEFIALAKSLDASVGALVEIQTVGEIEGPAEQRAKIEMRAEMETGHVDGVFHWVWHDVYWYLDRLELDVVSSK